MDRWGPRRPSLRIGCGRRSDSHANLTRGPQGRFEVAAGWAPTPYRARMERAVRRQGRVKGPRPGRSAGPYWPGLSTVNFLLLSLAAPLAGFYCLDQP